MILHRPSRLFQTIGQLRSADWLLLLAVFTLLLLGLSAIYSVELSQEASTFLHMKKQVVAALVGVAIFLSLALSNYKLLQNYSLALYCLCTGLLVLVLIVGETIRGSTGWFVLGGVSFQPVEIMKVSLVITLSTYFARRAVRPLSVRSLWQSGLMTLLPVGLVLLQPDFGSASVLLGTWFIFLLFVGMPWRAIVSMVLLMAVLFGASWLFLFADYQRSRILTFFDPSVDPLGQGYNVAQAIIAIGSGGWLGSGLGFGTQSQLKFLPESQTDFIFAVIAEELGFLGVMLVLVSFAFVFYRLIRHAAHAHDDFTSYLVLGCGTIFFLQFFVNIGMNLGVFPVTGIGLPWVSYGGSSLMVMLALVGIVESIAMRRPGGQVGRDMVS
ncbi:rod shape-determining protein RodA [Candidatus Uhrbacteria bacterium]|nr:rod shape-determining protein RodA [Candidatus Uhrbacteria bacterium]